MADYRDIGKSPRERAKALLAQMTLEEKVGQMIQLDYKRTEEQMRSVWAGKRGLGSYLHVKGREADEMQKLALQTRLGIPILFGIDCIRGHALNVNATVFPTQLAMAQSFDRSMLFDVGRVSAAEVRADGVQWTFSPVFCIARDIRWGRVDETFGEDPYLIGELGAAMVKGYQNDFQDNSCVLACAKHYIGYGEATGARDSVDAQLTERKIRELFLPPFIKALQAGCKTVMTAYGSIDGTPMTAHTRLLRQVLKQELGFDGFVVTDYSNVDSLGWQQNVAENDEQAALLAAIAGNDMIMHAPGFYESAIRLVQSGRLSIEVIDQAVLRILEQKFMLGLFEHPFDRPDTAIACKQHRDKALEVAQKSITLLENRNDTLPLDAGCIRTIAVVGPNADDLSAQYGDWVEEGIENSETSKMYAKTMLQGIREYAQPRGIRVLYERGCSVSDPSVDEIDKAVAVARQSDVVVAVVGDDRSQNGEYKDRANPVLGGLQEQLLDALRKVTDKLVVVLVNGKPLCIEHAARQCDALVETFNSGMCGGTALANILFGEINPSGKLPISFPRHVGQQPVYYNQPRGWHGGKYMDQNEKPLYPFGYGLSYTTFAYSDLQVSQIEFNNSIEHLKVSVRVMNTGEKAGTEVVQLYVRDMYSSVMQPVMELKGFERVDLQPGEQKQIVFTLPVRELRILRPDLVSELEPGAFKLMVGGSSDAELLHIDVFAK